MVAWGKAYAQRREDLIAMRAEHQEAEDKHAHCGTPHVNPLSASLAADLKPIRDRYKGLVWMKNFTLENKRAEFGKEKAAAYVLKPTINPRSSSLERSIEDLHKFGQHRDHKIEYKKFIKAQEETKDCPFKPKMGYCAIRSGITHYATDGKTKVHDRLYTDAFQRRDAQKAEEEKAKREEDQKKIYVSKIEMRLARSRSPRPPQVSSTPSPKPKTQLQRSRSLPASLSKGRLPAPSEAASPKTPRRKEPKRASAPVLPSKEELQGSQKKKKRPERKRGSRARSGYLNRARDGAESASQDEEEEKKKVVRCMMHLLPSAWTGGKNTVHVTPAFKTLLESLRDDDAVEVKQCSWSRPSTSRTHR